MARARDSKGRGRFDDDETEDDEKDGAPDVSDQDDEEDPDDENEGGDEQDEEMPPRRRVEKSVRTPRAARRGRQLRADRLIKAIEDEADERLSRDIREAIVAVLPEYEEHIEKAVGAPPRTEVRVSELVKGIGGEFSDATLPIVERQHRLEKSISEKFEEMMNAVTACTNALEDMAANQEKLQKAVESLPEQHDLLKAIQEEQDAKSRTTPARQNAGADAADAPTPLEKSVVPEIGSEAARNGLPDSEADTFRKALARAEAIRTEHFVEIPGYAQAVGAFGSGNVTREIAETLVKSVQDIESDLGLAKSL